MQLFKTPRLSREAVLRAEGESGGVRSGKNIEAKEIVRISQSEPRIELKG